MLNHNYNYKHQNSEKAKIQTKVSNCLSSSDFRPTPKPKALTNFFDKYFVAVDIGQRDSINRGGDTVRLFPLEIYHEIFRIRKYSEVKAMILACADGGKSFLPPEPWTGTKVP
jgi:hypothetical protein